MNMDEEYAAFISHKKEDLGVAKQLARKIKARGYSCYLDDQDKKLAEAKSAANPLEAVPLHLRDILRNCRSLIFVSSANSPLSRWMPWETGFFDGRYDKSAIGIYLTDATATEPSAQAGSTIQEYLNLYTTLTDANLADFLALTDNRTKMNVREGHIDQLMLAIRAATENPREFSVGCLQWSIGFWRSAIAQTCGEAVAHAWWPGAESALGKLRDDAAAEDFAARVRQWVPGIPQFPGMGVYLDGLERAHGEAAAASVAVRQLRR
jgi:hypothetical protein